MKKYKAKNNEVEVTIFDDHQNLPDEIDSFVSNGAVWYMFKHPSGTEVGVTPGCVVVAHPGEAKARLEVMNFQKFEEQYEPID